MASLFPTFEQSNPLLMGFQHGQEGYRRMVENQNLPEKLREALLAQQLANQQAQITNQYLPQEKQLGIEGMRLGNTHKGQINQFYPQQQQMAQQMKQMQMDMLRQSMAPGGTNDIEKQTALAKLAMLQQQSSPEYLQKQNEDDQRKRDYQQEMLEGAKVRRQMATGELPSRVIQNQLQQAQLGMRDISQIIPEILEGQKEYLGGKGPAKKYLESIRTSFGFGGQEEQKRVEKYNRSEDLITQAAEKMMRYGLLPRVKKSYEDVRKIFEPRVRGGVPESAKSYDNRIRKELESIYGKYKENETTMREGMAKSIVNEDKNPESYDEFSSVGGYAQ